jgi:hypothetical protein
MNPPEYPPFEPAPWTEHIYSSLKFSEATIRQLHDLLEHDQVNDEVRAQMSKAIYRLDTARDEAVNAWIKMGIPLGDEARTRETRIAMIEETKAQVLEVNAAYLEKVLADAGENYAAVISAVRDAIYAMKTEATAIAARVKKELGGPPR